jgi:hypothetical protein
MKFTVAYCAYANPYIYVNLKNHYDYADEIIISYGPFKDYPKYRELMGLEPEDDTLNIIKDFIQKEDAENKIKLIVQKDGFKNFTESRNSWLPHVTGDWFCSLDCDEVYYLLQMKLAREMMDLYLNSDVNMLQCNRRSFAIDVNHHYENSWYPKLFPHGTSSEEIATFQEDKMQTLQHPNTIGFKNGTAVVPENGFDLFSVVAYKNKPGMKWVENSIDSFLVDGEGTPYFADIGNVIYEPNIRYNHYAACGNPYDYFAKQLYYHVVRGAINSEDELMNKVEYYKNKINNNPYAMMVWFENNPGVYFRRMTELHPEIFDELDFPEGEKKNIPEADKVVDLDFEQRKEMHSKYSV